MVYACHPSLKMAIRMPTSMLLWSSLGQEMPRKSDNKMSTSSSLSDFSSLSRIASCPVALKGLMPFSNFRIPFLMTILERPLDGWLMSDVSSFVNTDVNCWFRMSAFFKLWLTPFDERGATPLVSHYISW